MDLHGLIPTLIAISGGKQADVGALDGVRLEARSLLWLDRGYLDFQHSAAHYPGRLRRLSYKNPVTGKVLVFLSNNFDLPRLLIAYSINAAGSNAHIGRTLFNPQKPQSSMPRAWRPWPGCKTPLAAGFRWSLFSIAAARHAHNHCLDADRCLNFIRLGVFFRTLFWPNDRAEQDSVYSCRIIFIVWPRTRRASAQ